ncbi:MAG: response regulator [Chitinophagales bacterium]
MDSKFTVLIADDDNDDKLLVRKAFAEFGHDNAVIAVNDGLDLINYLEEALNGEKSIPSLIMLDLNMPRIDGKAALAHIKSSDEFRHIPVAIFSTSNQEDEVRKCYQLGANCYISKPDSFGRLVTLMQNLYRFWFESASLPKSVDGHAPK